MPGMLLATNVIEPLTPINVSAPQCSKWVATPSCVQPHCGPRATQTAIPTSAQQQIITQHAMSILTMQEQALFSTIHTPPVLMKHINSQ
jgi:hypothetical protein